MSKHTPAPWKYGIRGDNYNEFVEKPFDYRGPGFYENPAIFGSDGTEVVGCDEYMIFNNEADARLIAAAPDLLEALMLADAMLSGANMNGDVVEKKVHAAIAKALGEKQ